MSISRKKLTINFDYLIGLDNLNKLNKVKDLGLIYDNQFRFGSHINKLVNSANHSLGFIYRQTSIFSIKTIKILYNVLIKPKLEFGCLVWGDQPQIHLAPIEKTQNKFLRYLYFRKYHVWPDYTNVRSSRLRAEFNIISLTSRRILTMMLFLYK
ncbi:unnamed protein product, partial [Psylliodes chrysocephalus]